MKSDGGGAKGNSMLKTIFPSLAIAATMSIPAYAGHYRLRGDRVFGRVATEDYKNVWMGRAVEKGAIDIGPYEALMAHNRRAMKVCQEAKAICIDVSKDLAFEEGDQYDLIHTTPTGSAKLAKFIFERLKAQID